jgi:AraC-like DNA-binding protein
MHEEGGQYKKGLDGKCHQSAKGWCDTEVGKDMIFSHRQNDYTAENFTEGLHSHDYYELLFYIHGKVEYVCDNVLISPTAPTAVWFSPGQMHTARLRSPSRYERYVLYFSKDFFKTEEGIAPILDFMESGAHAIPLPEAKQADLLRVLKRADELSGSPLPHAPLLIKAYLLELFDLLSDPLMKAQTGRDFEDPMAAVKQFIDERYAEISSVSQVAEHCFYSREHLSRAFARSFNISVAAYITRRRVAEGLKLLSHMRAADASYTVGFRSQSAFIAAFKKYTGYLPSEHAAKMKQA